MDTVTGEIVTVQKGGFERAARASDRALKVLRKYLKVRRAEVGVEQIFTTWAGKPISYDGGQMIFRRLKVATGIDWAHAHRFRHTWAQNALDNGAERQLVQDAMGWRSDRMARRYQGASRMRTAAAQMPQFSPV
jgi:integrase/recombinase XerC/integrase/recombinase XerD